MSSRSCACTCSTATTKGKVRVTELPNQLTEDIDKCDSLGIVHLLRQSDAQLFSGWGVHDSIQDTSILHKMDVLASKAASMLRANEKTSSKNVIVFTGCGTSGRIAWAVSRSFNRLLSHLQREPCFRYLIAGGDKALIVGDELPEDDPPRGAKDLSDLVCDADEVLLVGITCGLSAPYVAGQIDHAMLHQDRFTTVVIGFNPVELARDSIIEKWDKTCKETFLKLQILEGADTSKGMILNPIVGPEPITGSSRMKGGSMTTILLDAVFSLALSRGFSISLSNLLGPHLDTGTVPDIGSRTSQVGVVEDKEEDGACHELDEGEREVGMLIDAFSATYNAAYRPAVGIASIVNIAGSSLCHHEDGHVYYIGAQLLGIIGFIDGSEMVATFGSSLDEFRGFLEGGWETCQNRDGDLSHEGHPFHISFSEFAKEIVPNLRACDCVIWIRSCTDYPNKEGDEIRESVLNGPAQSCLLEIIGEKENRRPLLSDSRFATTLRIRIPHFDVLGKEPLFGAFALKLILNVISTGANILKGRVYQNSMINLTVANDKLFYRSISIVSSLCEVSEKKAEVALLKAIYRDDSADKYLQSSISDHIIAAVKQNMVVPLAVILARRECTIMEAVNVITSAKSLRTVVERVPR